MRSLIISFPLFWFLLFGFSGCGQGNKKAELQSSLNMKILLEAIHKYHEEHNQWPEKLADVKDHAYKVIEERGEDTDFMMVMINPLTGDDPGYEFIQPKEGDGLDTTVMLYQLSSGERQEDLPVGYQSGSVAPLRK
jgi:hypothetical protein